MLHTEKDICNYIEQSEYMMNVLNAAQSGNLPNWFIGAGFVRNTIWSVQHSYETEFSFNDIDLGYFSKETLSEDDDRKTSKILKDKFNTNWEVVNQAYAHKYNNVPPYKSAEDGLAHWIETATCVAVSLSNGKVTLIAPWGIEDLLSLKLRLSPCHKGNVYYENLFHKRIRDKHWLQKWPQLEIVTN